MKALELLKNQEQLLVENSIKNKKVKTLSSSLNSLIIEMNNQINSYNEYLESQKEGSLNAKIILAKSLAEFFKNNKFLKLDLLVDSLRNEEKNKINEYYNVKSKLLDTVRAIIKESAKEAVVSAFDIFEGEFTKCPENHEIIILGDRNISILETFLKEIDTELIIGGNFENIPAQNVDFNSEVLDRNIELCNRKNQEVNASKQSRASKIELIINKLRESGEKVVAFYTYKEMLLEIGCNPKGVKDFENELSKVYIPLKKTLQKELKVELEDICNIVVNEEEYSDEHVYSEINNLPSDSDYNSNQTVDNSIFTPNPTTNNSIFTPNDVNDNSNLTTNIIDNSIFNPNNAPIENSLFDPIQFNTQETQNNVENNSYSETTQFNTTPDSVGTLFNEPTQISEPVIEPSYQEQTVENNFNQPEHNETTFDSNNNELYNELKNESTLNPYDAMIQGTNDYSALFSNLDNAQSTDNVENNTSVPNNYTNDDLSKINQQTPHTFDSLFDE